MVVVVVVVVGVTMTGDVVVVVVVVVVGVTITGDVVVAIVGATMTGGRAACTSNGALAISRH